MRDLKTLLELLLNEWESCRHRKIKNHNRHSCLCILVHDMNSDLVFNDKEMNALFDFIDRYIETGNYYLFYRHAHNERVEWLKERIKELEK